MLEITIPKFELYDEGNNEFLEIGPYNLSMEHSLVSISKWESKWHKPFIGQDNLSNEEVVDYFRCMTITKNVNPIAYSYLSSDNIKKINEYIDDPMTGTTFYEFLPERSEDKKKISSEEIYSKMILLEIPFECEKWHINRLLTLIRVCNLDRSDKKMTKMETMKAYQKLNAERRKNLKTKG